MLRLSLTHSVLSVAAVFFSLQLQAAPATSDAPAAKKATADHSVAIAIKATSPCPQAQPASPEDVVPASEVKETTTRPIAIASKKVSPNPHAERVAPGDFVAAQRVEETSTRPIAIAIKGA